MLLIRLSILVICMLHVAPLFGRDLIRSSVSPDFIDGLHAKYLKNIARRMNMELEITPMPFARRIRALRNGEIDLMVGMQRETDDQDEIVYLYPSYETLRHTFFILEKNTAKLQSFEDLQRLNIGVTVHARYFDRFNQQANLAMVSAVSLSQKVELLLRGRIDTFIHFQESTLPKLRTLGGEDKIVLADYQPNERNEYHVTMSQNSPLIAKKALFEQAVKMAVANNEFALTRQAHYAAKN